jgi:large subunit ribosomal protein L21
MYALVEIKGKQYKAEKGKWITVDLYEEAEGSNLEFPVLFLSNEGKSQVGLPYVAGVRVKATVQESFRDKKVDVFKYNRRKGYRKARGHRQSYTKLLVTDIAA